jgi:hypothetical protein
MCRGPSVYRASGGTACGRNDLHPSWGGGSKVATLGRPSRGRTASVGYHAVRPPQRPGGHQVATTRVAWQIRLAAKVELHNSEPIRYPERGYGRTRRAPVPASGPVILRPFRRTQPRSPTPRSCRPGRRRAFDVTVGHGSRHTPGSLPVAIVEHQSRRTTACSRFEAVGDTPNPTRWRASPTQVILDREDRRCGGSGRRIRLNPNRAARRSAAGVPARAAP